MQEIYEVDKTFEKHDFTESALLLGEYEHCTFKNCIFSNADLSNIKFTECMFADCNLSLVKIANSAFRDVTFKDCKMLGLRFDTCNKFGMKISFENCNLTHSSFYQCKLKNMLLKNSVLREVDFTYCDLTNVVFDTCDLLNATFENTILEKTDFRKAFNYSINPEINSIKKARFSTLGLAGLLQKYDIEIE